jgi:exonuclease SbcD
VRLLHVADTHLGLTRYSTPGTTSRADDFAKTLLRFAEIATDEKVDAVFIAGDTFHTRRPLPRDLLSLATALDYLRQYQHIPAYIVPGNHDGMDTVGDPRTHALAWMKALRPSDVHVLIDPTAAHFHYSPSGHFNLVSVPYPHKRAFDSSLPHLDPEERVREIGRRLEVAIDAMIDKVQADEDAAPTIFMGHLSVAGAVMGSEVAMRLGWDVAIRGSILDKVDYGALGHIHRQQQAAEKAWYAGSPEYVDFGEEGQRKGFLLVDVERGKPPKVESIDSHPRPLATITKREVSEGEWVQDGTFEPGAIVRLRIQPLSAVSPRTFMQLQRDVRSAGASYVKAEPIVVDQERVARAQVNPQTEAVEALRRWLVGNGHELEPVLSAGRDLINEVSGRDD